MVHGWMLKRIDFDEGLEDRDIFFSRCANLYDCEMIEWIAQIANVRKGVITVVNPIVLLSWNVTPERPQSM